jgi:hypothetical protein
MNSVHRTEKKLDSITHLHVCEVRIINGGLKTTVLLEMYKVKMQQCYLQANGAARAFVPLCKAYKCDLSYPWCTQRTQPLFYDCFLKTYLL